MVIEVDDEVFFIVVKVYICVVMGEMCRFDDSYKWIIIVGGGNVGECLVEVIESCYQVKIIECSLLCCWYFLDILDSIIVFNGSVFDCDLLLEENIGEIDVFFVLINDDEVNIMFLLLVKWFGVSKVMILINNFVYVDLV